MTDAKKTAHTPGPWMVSAPSVPTPSAPHGGDYSILDGGTNIIAETFHQVSAETFRPAEANARLIAAAPDLLGALKLAVREMQTCRCDGTDLVIADCERAIAKAAGAPA